MSDNTDTRPERRSTTPKIDILCQAETIEAERRELGHFAERNPTRQGAGRFPQGKIYES
ncbi:MAG: hypothetical protein V7776_13005 [Halopseudomonas aestusnigri]